jgi:membrane peptidoglycan carboxypeptidase
VLGGLVVLSVIAGLLAGAVLLPVVGVIGVVTRNAALTFNTLRVPKLGVLPSRSEILDRKGRLISYYYPRDIDRVPVSYRQIAPDMRNAIIAIEDSRFYQHGAFDLRGTLRALVNDLEHNPVQGGSTLAQQYVKNALILTGTSPNVAAAETPARKIRELRMAAVVEHLLTKSQLLAAYLNAAYFENGAYGIQVAARRYFHTTAKKLTLPQAAMLAGMVQDPALYDPVIHKGYALQRRNTVLQRMQRLGYITAARQQAADRAPLGLNLTTTALQSGCSSRSARKAAFFCEYVLAVMKDDPAYADAYKTLNTVGGLKIYTTMATRDQRAAEHAVMYMVPPPPSPFNPGRNAAAEVLIQPRTGDVRAIAVDRRYGNDKAAGRDNIDYAVDSRYDGGVGVQTGSSNKIFTLLTALKLGYPFGYHLKIVSPSTLTGYTNCKGEQTSPFMVSNAEGPGAGIYSLYTGTTDSINVFYATLERNVGLCDVVRTAASLGDHRANGRSLFQAAGNPEITGQYRADDLPSFTLGSVNVSPMTMAAAYATVAARGIYCRPIAISQIITGTGSLLPVKSARCHRVISTAVADAANHIFQGVMQSGTGAPDQIPGLPTAGKTGTANNAQYVAFAGFTPRLVGYVSMFNPAGPVTHPMIGTDSCFRAAPNEGGGLDCPGFEFGVNAGQIWQYTFEHANLGHSIVYFAPVPPSSPFYSEGSGIISPVPPKPKISPVPPKKPAKGHSGGTPPKH